MPNHLKAYIVIMAIGFMCYVLWQRAASGLSVIDPEGPGVRRATRLYFVAWVTLTSVAFLSFNYYIFIGAAVIAVMMVRKTVPEQAQGGLYIVLLLALPALAKTIPGVFGLNKIVELSWPVILGLVFAFSGKSRKTFAIKTRMDSVVIALFALVAVLSFRDTSITDGLRSAFLYFSLICIPYFIARKWCTNLISIRYCFFGLAFVVFVLSGIAIFVSLRNWNLYETLNAPMGLDVAEITGYKYREGFLRTSVTLGAIHLAIVGFCGVVMYLYLAESKRKSLSQWLILGIFLFSIILTFSRAPWLIGAGMVSLYLAMAHRSKGLVYLLVSAMVFSAILMASGMLDAVRQGFFLKDGSNVEYRQQLLELGSAEIMHYPFFGNVHFMGSPRLQVLRQGEGIIDIVNTYLQVGLQFGLIALALFVCVVVVWPIAQYRKLRKTRDEGLLRVVRVYLVVMLGFGAVIFTVSSFGSGSAFFALLMFYGGAGHGLKRR